MDQKGPVQASSASHITPFGANSGQASQALPVSAGYDGTDVSPIMEPQQRTAHYVNEEPSYAENRPVPAQPSYPGGYRPSNSNIANPSVVKTETDPVPQYFSPHAEEPQPVSEPAYEHQIPAGQENIPHSAYEQPTAPFSQNFSEIGQPHAIQESETKPAVVPSYSAPAGPSSHNYGYTEERPAETEVDYSRGQASVFQIEVEKIFPNPQQPRKHFDEGSLNDLANSIREFGIIQPLVVTKVLKETESGTEVSYQLIAGERRLMAAKKVGLRTVPAVVKKVGMDRERLELAIIENIQRENLNPLEAARSYARLQDEFGLTQREIAIRMGKSRETIANTLRLLNLPSEVQQALEDGRINESHARLLLQIDNIARQKEMFQSILRSKPSVRELKATIRREKTGPSGNYLNPELMSLQSRLEEFLGTKAQIDDNGGKGKITINYYSPEELSSLIGRLSGEDF
jgi:ParB family chromosome partitioning protein